MAMAKTEHLQSGQSLTLSDRLREMLARLAGSPRFQDWISGFPPTRPLARHQAKVLFDLSAGFVYSQVLYAFVTAGLLDALKQGPRSTAELTAIAKLPAPALQRLLTAAVGLGLASRRSHARYGLGLRGAALAGNPGAVAMIRHHKMLYADLEDPLALLRGESGATQIGQFWRYIKAARPEDLSTDAVASYSDLMAVSQRMIADVVVRDFPFRSYARILDVGGGTGTFLQRVSAVAPHAALTLFDLPPVARNAAARLDAIGLSQRIDAVGGDFTADVLPPEQDLITLVRVVYDHDDERVVTLLKACRTALSDKGALLIAEPLSGGKAGARVADAYFGFYLLAMGSGLTRTPEAYRTLLRQAGFSRMRVIDTRMPMLVRLILARP